MASSPTDAAIALTRLGLGARPGEIERVAADPRGWATAQIRPQGAPQPSGQFADTAERVAQYVDYQSDAGQVRRDRRPPTSMASDTAQTASAADPQAVARREARQAARRDITQDTAQEFLARAQLGATTDDGFAERWTLFWANAVTVSAVKFASGAFVGQYEREAIRPHVFGRFEDLVLAAEQHPAMLLYLDQARSVGPDSMAGARRNAGLNENLAREMMELHTVGADGGYTQGDVTELARALTGWSIPTARDQGQTANPSPNRPRRARAMANQIEPGPDGFVFRANVHEPGPRTVMGKTYPASGLAQGQAILRDLARHPATAKRLSHRLAAHFVADDPPPALVARLEDAWTRSGGDLAQVARALVEAPETWTPQPAKIKTPYEFVVSTHRALGTRPQRIQPLRQALLDMGQPPFAAPSPEGWPDAAADWAGPDALVKRLNWSRTAADAAQAADPSALAVAALGARLSERTRLAVARAESRPEALTLLFMSPEFQRR